MAIETKTIRIGGMTCVNCQNRIEKKLLSAAGIKDAKVDFNTGTAAVSWDTSVITFHEIAKTIEDLDYEVLEDGQKKEPQTSQIIGTLIIILALYMLLRQFGISGLSSAYPLAETGMGYGMLFVIGLITSVHCIAMCGGINLSQCIPAAGHITVNSGGASRSAESRLRLLLPSILYNAGRVISYTIVGVIVGALGQVITLSGRFQGLVQLLAGIFMVLMGVNMLGIFPVLRRFNLSMPKIFAKKIDEQKTADKNPLVIGLLNGLMPCGPLQAMQIYALSTGSPIGGGIAMFLFSMGTVPLMFGIGALSSVLSKQFTARVMKIGAVLVTVLGLAMFSNGWNLSGFNFNFFDRLAAFSGPASSSNSRTEAFEPVIENGVQIINSTLSGGRFPAITVQQGIPGRWTIDAPQGSITGCNKRMIIREYGIEHSFTNGANIIEFIPEKTGKFSYSCWMGMIRSSITVVKEGETIAVALGEPDTNPVPAGVSIPNDEIVLAGNADIQGIQRVSIKLRDEGISPAIVVMERNARTEWTINNDSLDPGNGILIFPLYYAKIEMTQGDNVIRLIPTEDFAFSTGDNVFYGYVKVVDNIANVDIEAVKNEAAGYETKIYPDSYFASAQGESCH